MESGEAGYGYRINTQTGGEEKGEERGREREREREKKDVSRV